jgi:hypothetical protein
VCALAACHLTGPIPADAIRFQPPAIYARWWSMTEACSGRSGDFASVQWYRVPQNLVGFRGEWVAGYWNSAGNQIVLGEVAVERGAAVRHEMLHALVRERGHPRAEFVEACAGLVDCERHCVADAGPWQPPAPVYALVPPESLDVDSKASALPPEADGQRWVSLTVTVRNRSDRAVLVDQPAQWVLPRAFLVDLRRVGGRGYSWEQLADDSSRIFFRPHETKSELFEFRGRLRAQPDFCTAGDSAAPRRLRASAVHVRHGVGEPVTQSSQG